MIKFLELANINQRFSNQFKKITETFLESGYYVLGKEVNAFENAFAKYCGAEFCCGVGNGLDALILILEGYKAIGRLKEGDEVILPANTFIATILAVSKAGLTPILVEPNESTFNLSVKNVRDAITPKTKAIMTVHLYGQTTPMKEMKALADEYNFLLLEDAAQSHGAMIDGKRAGAWGDAAAFSFYPGKNLGALGDGGAITTSDSELNATIRSYRNYGSDQKYVHSLKGVNSRLDELQAAFLSVKLKNLDVDNEHRRKIAEHYEAGINNPLILTPTLPENRLWHVWHLYVIRCTDRDRLQKYLRDNAIETLIHYPTPPHKQLAYKELSHMKLPLTESIHKSVLSLPIYPTLVEKDVQHVVNVLNKFR